MSRCEKCQDTGFKIIRDEIGNKIGYEYQKDETGTETRIPCDCRLTCNCRNTGFIIIRDEKDQEVSTMCVCRLKKEEILSFDQKLIGASIPKDYRSYTFETYDKLLLSKFSPEIQQYNQPAIEKLKSFIKNPNDFIDNYNILWIWGADDNSGHTSLAIILGVEFIKQGGRVKFISCHDLFNAFTKFDEKQDFFKDLDSYQIYIIDDALDPERSYMNGSYTKINFFTWINDSLNNNKKFICTCNTPLIKVSDIYSQIRSIMLRKSLSIELQGSYNSTLEKLSKFGK